MSATELYVALVWSENRDAACLGVFDSIARAKVAVHRWNVKRRQDAGRTVGWFDFHDLSGAAFANGRLHIDGKEFGPNCAFIRPVRVNEPVWYPSTF